MPRFRATIELHGRTATGIEVPSEVVDGLDAGRRPPVRVTIGSHSYRTTVASRGGRFLVPLSAEQRAGAGVAAGDEVDVDVELDTAPREVDVPADLAAALDAFRAAVDASLRHDGVTLVHVRTDRAENRALHARVADAVLAR